MSRTAASWLVASLVWAMACARIDRNIGSYAPNEPTASSDAGAPAHASADSGGGSAVGGQSGEAGVPGSAGAPDACAVQLADYDDYRMQVLAEFSSFGCEVDGDCLAFYDQSACDPSCALHVTGAGRGVVDRLNNYETSNCAMDCWPQPWTSCPAPTKATCVAGRCQ